MLNINQAQFTNLEKIIMFNQNIKRLGFACKISEKVKNKVVAVPNLNFKSTTVKWLSEQTAYGVNERLWYLTQHNLLALKNAIEYVSKLDQSLRMYRIGSDCLPLYTHEQFQPFWKQSDVRSLCESELSKIGKIARDNDIRLSMHPGQFTVLASDNDAIVENSIKEFEYHTDIARWMGYGKQFQDFKINVHISGKRGPDGIKQVLPRLSSEARNCITIENDENKWGIDASLELANDCALVLDIHHHFVNTGEYIKPNDSRYLRIIDSWNGVRPVIHYSYSRHEFVGHIENDFPNMQLLKESGCKRQKLRAHSDDYPNHTVNEWALSFSNTADIMCESKNKNLATTELYNKFKDQLM